MSVKQECDASPAQGILTERLAKYAYTSPSTSRVTPTKAKQAIKVEQSPINGCASRTPARRPIKDEPLSPVYDGSTSTAREGEQTSRTGPSTGYLASDDDLESLTGEVDIPTPLRRSARRSAVTRYVATPSASSSDDGSYRAYSEDPQEEEVQARRQKRIKTSRTGRNERYLLSTPSRQDLSATGAPTSGSKKERRKAQGGDEPVASPRRPRAYADPEMYRHLKPLPDILAPNLDLVFCGINPGMKSSKLGHHFAHPTNKFWRSLHYSGLTARLVSTSEDHLMPTEYNYGLTVLVDRPTAEQSELSTHEMRLNALPFTEKLLRLKPRIVCFVGKKIWDVYESVIAKNATAASPCPTAANGPGPVKVEPGHAGDPTLPMTPVPVKAEPIEHDGTPMSTVSTPRKTKLSKPKFDWTQPRPFRLPHDGGGYTYFWVVPNTSGLERTPLAEQIVLFGHLNRFRNELKTGRLREMAYREFDLEGVKRTVDQMQLAAERRASQTPASA